ncbi:MAG: neutral/alkaline non-lysosomal ceramidase N-terminal domain-containing protein, partial [Rectinema sp.]|nr:neutral/alkaline non-lysosomal ceramidase N-terminal domain-containing protein [Rectinema sp.]
DVYKRQIHANGYECLMIALGACLLLEDWKRGQACIDAVLATYYDYSPNLGPLLLDVPHSQTSNPGHAIEFAGLALQCLRRSDTTAPEANTHRALLSDIARNALTRFRAPHGGIVRQISTDTGTIIDSRCPWWSIFEAVRTLSELLALSHVEETEALMTEIASCLDCIERRYCAPSKIGIPVQTLSFEGEVIPFIPATPDLDPGYHTGIPLMQAYGVLASMACLQAGGAESRIPARIGARLQGHIARTGTAERELDPLRVRALWLSSPWTRVLIVSADVLEFDTLWATRMRQELSRRFMVPEDNIILAATHVHTAPPTISLAGLEPDDVFLHTLKVSMVRACDRALRRLQPVAILPLAVRVPGIGINRRSRDPQSGRIMMRPNPMGDRDDVIRALFFLDAKNRPCSVLINTAVHPTTLGVCVNAISADYPGRAAALLGTKLRGVSGTHVPVIVLQGACGDVRPMILTESGKDFREGTEADILRFGRIIAQACYDALVLSVSYTHL